MNTQLTQPGQQQQSLMEALNSIRNAPSPQVAQNNVMSAITSLSGSEPGALQQYQQNMTQQNVQPLMNQYGNLSKLFDMYLHDQNLAQNYSNQFQPMASPAQSTTPISADTTSAQAIAQGQGLGATPNLTTAAMGSPVYATSNMLNALTGAVYNQQGLVNQNMGYASQNYQNLLNTLGTLFNYYGNKSENAINTPGTLQNTGATYQGIIDTLQKSTGGKVSYDDIWNYINDNQDALSAQGVDVPGLWQMQKSQADRMKGAGQYYIEGGKSPKAVKAEQDFQKGVDSLRNFGNLMNDYYQNITPIGGTNVAVSIGPVGPEAGYFTSRDLYARAIGKQLGASRSQLSYESIAQGLPGAIESPDKAQRKFKAHLQTLMTATGMRIGIGKDGNYHVMSSADWNPDQYKSVDINSLPIQTVQDILNSL